MTQVELLMQDVQKAANTMTDEVLDRLLTKLLAALEQADPFDCQKHTVLQLQASIAAIRLWRVEKKRSGWWKGIAHGWRESDYDYARALGNRESTSREFHTAECTCHLTRKERISRFANFMKEKEDGRRDEQRSNG